MSLIKDNHIQLKDKDYKPSGGRFSQEQIAKMKQEAERAKQIELEAESLRERVKQLENERESSRAPWWKWWLGQSK